MNSMNKSLCESRTAVPVAEFVGADALTARQLSEHLRRNDAIREASSGRQAALRQAVREGRMVPVPSSWAPFSPTPRPTVPESRPVPVRESHAAPVTPTPPVPVREAAKPTEQSSGTAEKDRTMNKQQPNVDPVAAFLNGTDDRADETADGRRRREVWERASRIFLWSDNPDLFRFNREGFELAITHRLDDKADFTADDVDDFLKSTAEMFRMVEEAGRENSGTSAFAG
jgi:hypothetical protein